MKVYILILSLFCLAGCSAFESSKIVKANDQPPTSNNVLNVNSPDGNAKRQPQTAQNDQLATFDCSQSKDYRIEKDKTAEFNLVKIVHDARVVETIKLPTGASQNGFALNRAEKTEPGFEISIEYGSRIYYEKRFDFECRENQFYLARIKVNTFDKQNPEKSGKEYESSVKPIVPLSKFRVSDYLTD